MEVYERVARAMTQRPEADAVRYQGTWVKFRDFSEIESEVSGVAERALLNPGARVGLVARDRPAHVAALASALARGLCVVMIRPDEAAAEIESLRLPLVIAAKADLSEAAVAAARQAGSVALSLNEDDPIVPLQIVPGRDEPADGVPLGGDPAVAVEAYQGDGRVKLGWDELAAGGGTPGAPLAEAAGVRALGRFLVEGEPVELPG